MSDLSITPDERFADLVDDLAPNPDVTPPETGPQARRRFGASALKVRGKIFAMLTNGRLTLKLPPERVNALIAAGVGERWNPRHDGRQTKAWVSIVAAHTDDWLPLAQEAMLYVAAQQPQTPG